MTGTREGGIKSSNILKQKFSKEQRAEWSRKGGLAKRPKGFASEVVGVDGLTGLQRAKIAGSKGGKVSSARRAA